MRRTIPFHSWTLWIALIVTSIGGFRQRIVAPAAPGSSYLMLEGDLACNDTINVTLNENCMALITPDMVLEGDMGCLTDEDFEISIYDNQPDNGPQLDGYGIFQYEIRRKEGADCAGDSFTGCWGVIRAEDKTAPRLTCPDDRALADRPQPVQRIAGALTGNDENFVPGTAPCLSDLVTEAGSRYFDRYEISVSEKAVYTFELQATFEPAIGGLYQASFDPAVPCQRLLGRAEAVTDGTGFFKGNAYRLAVELLPGRTYVLVTSSGQAAQTGDYLWAVYSGGRGALTGVPAVTEPVRLPLYCANIDSVYQIYESTDFLGVAGATDNCGVPFPVGVEDELQPAADCEDRVVARTFTFSDKNNNQSSCTQLLTFPQAGLEDVVLPPSKGYVSCDEDIMLDENGNPHPMVTGRPFLQSAFGPLFLDQVTCGIGASYTDEEMQKQCSDTRLIHRLWKIVDWCHQGEQILFSQRLMVGDFTAPVVQCPAAADGGALQFSTAQFSCFADFEVPLPVIIDNCSSGWDLTVQILVDGTEKVVELLPGTTDYHVSNIPTGSHLFRYIVRDECGNETVKDCEFLVADRVDPVAVCNEAVNVSIGGAGLGSVTAVDMDEGSWDNCDKELDLKVRRVVPEEFLEAYRAQVDTVLFLDETTGEYYTPWRDKVDFTCAEVGAQIRVELKATDDGQLSNICWLDVLVEDKIPPRCLPPHDISIACDSLAFIDETNPAELQEFFGQVMVEDNCTATPVELEAELQLDNCGTGVLIRRFQAVDGYGNESGICEQRITLTPRHNYEIRFPKDIENFSCGDQQLDTIDVREIACDVLAVSRDTTYFESDDEACYKMFIKYRVINWCEYEEGESPVVIGRDEDGDGIPGDEAVYVLRRPPHPDSTYIDANDDEGDGYFRTETSVGFWEYTQMIKVYDNTPPDVITPSWQGTYCALNDCFTEVDLLFDIVDNCPNQRDGVEFDLKYDESDDGGRQDLDVSLYIKGRYPKQRISGDFPIGRHAFYLTITDGCGNTTSEKIPFEVVDCKPPAPICIERLAAELMPIDFEGDGEIDGAANTIWATDFLASESFDCSGVTYSVNRVGDTPHPDSTFITVTCDDPEILPVEVYAWDNAYNPEAIQPDGTIGGPNYSHCIVRVFVQDNRFNLCGRNPGATIGGLIATEFLSTVEGVTVSLSGQSNQTVLTDHTGSYSFGNIFEGYDYSIVPKKEEQPANGVTTFDLLLISKHILGVKALDSPYKVIAADINRSGSITTLDLIQVRKLILGTLLDFPDNSSWRFVRADYDFPDTGNPWAAYFPELVNINDLSTQDPFFYDFVAVKVGDVNGSAAANALDAAEPRSDRNDWRLMTTDRELRIGEVYEVVLRAQPGTSVEGFQFTLDFDPAALALVDVKPGLLQTFNIGTAFLEAGRLTASWNTSGREETAEDLVTLVLRAKTSGHLSDFLQLNSGFTPAEAYSPAGELLDIELDFRKPERGAFTLFPNHPNPFREETTIRFFLPEPGPVTLSVRDVAGREIYRQTGRYDAGNNAFTIQRADLSGERILFYTVSTAKETATRKMVMLGR